MGLKDLLLNEAELSDKIDSNKDITYGSLVSTILLHKDKKIHVRNMTEIAKDLGISATELKKYVEEAKKLRFLNKSGTVTVKYAKTATTGSKQTTVSKELDSRVMKFIAPKVTNNNLFSQQVGKMLSMMSEKASGKGSKHSYLLAGDPGVGKCLSGDTELEVLIDDDLYDAIIAKRTKQKRIVTNLKRDTYTSQYLNIDFWLSLESNIDNAIFKCKTCRFFKEYFTGDIKNSKNWKSESITLRLQEIRTQILTFKYNKKTELPLFSDKHSQVNFWLFRGWTNEEAKRKVFGVQSKNGIKGNKILSSSMTSTEFNKRKNVKKEFYLAKGMTQEEAELTLKDRQSTFSKTKMIETYGEEEGLKKIEERNKKWFETLKENNDWDELSKKKDSSSFDYCLQKTSTHSDALELYAQKCRKKDYSSLNYFKSICNSEEEAQERYTNRKKKKNLGGTVSKESTRFIERIIDIYNLEGKEYYYDKNEYRLERLEDGRFYYYDFTIPDFKLIVEYHGVGFHPNPEWDPDTWTKWLHPYNKKSANHIYVLDRQKKEVAEQNGFNVIEIYSDDIEKGLNEITEFFKKESNHEEA